MLNGKPLCIDGYCGLGGWSEGFLSVGWNVIGFDIEQHVYGGARYPGQLVLQDMLTVHGAQLKDADCLVMSPPCQNYSYLAMPWSKSTDPNNSKAAKALRKKWETEGPDNRLFDACFRIQREAIATAGHFIPLIVENVRGAQEWVGKRDMPLDEWKKLSKEERLILGRARAKYGSFYLWGDVEQVGDRILAGADIGKFGAVGLSPGDGFKGGDGSWFAIANNTNGHSQNPVHALASGMKVPGFRFDGSGRSFQTSSVEATGVKVPTDGDGRRTDIGNGARFTSRDCGIEGTKQPAGKGDWFSKEARDGGSSAKHGSRSNARKAASAMIAKIPLPLSQYIAQAFKP